MVTVSPLSLGVHSLTEGEHVFSVEIVGKNEIAHQGCLFGLDYIDLEPINAR